MSKHKRVYRLFIVKIIASSRLFKVSESGLYRETVHKNESMWQKHQKQPTTNTMTCSCSRCKSTFVDEPQTTRASLPCGHHLCRGCKYKSDGKCPTCNARFSLMSGIAFPNDQAAQAAKKSIQAQKKIDELNGIRISGIFNALVALNEGMMGSYLSYILSHLQASHGTCHTHLYLLTDAYSILRCEELKAILRRRNLPTSGNKRTLIVNLVGSDGFGRQLEYMIANLREPIVPLSVPYSRVSVILPEAQVPNEFDPTECKRLLDQVAAYSADMALCRYCPV